MQEAETIDVDFWMNNFTSQKIVSWRGLAFEDVCYRHISQIKRELVISGVSTTLSSWIVRGDEEKVGTQVDILINRKDNVDDMKRLILTLIM